MPPDPGRLRLFFYVQHLLGIGHLHRAARIAKAASDDGFAVRLVLGGPPTPSLDVGGAEIVRLPPVKAGPDGFASLVHPDGRTFGPADEADRARLLRRQFDDHAPDILLTEAFPFGRRQMRFELLPLLEYAQARPAKPLIAASVRDILQQARKPARVAETIDVVRRSYDLVLVHGDPVFQAFEASFPAAGLIADRLAYTGLVAPPRPSSEGVAHRSYGVVVSVGGGAVGERLLRAAVAARPFSRFADRPWLVLAGPNGSSDALGSFASPGLHVERFVPNLVDVLGRAEVSVSQAGYNTVADVLAAGVRAVIAPYAEGGETEQAARAQRLAETGFAVTVPEAEVTPARLAAAIESAWRLERPAATPDLNGARATVRLLRAAHARLRTSQGGEDRSPLPAAK